MMNVELLTPLDSAFVCSVRSTQQLRLIDCICGDLRC